MLRFLLLVIVIVTLAIVFTPQIARALSWVLAFLILLMLGDLLLSGLRKLR